MSAMGVKIDKFDVPVCNAFEAKIMKDQLCYEVDLNRFSDSNNIEKELDIGFSFLLDYNEDRQVTFDQDYKEESELELSLGNSVVASDQSKHAFIYLDTIGNFLKHEFNTIPTKLLIVCEADLEVLMLYVRPLVVILKMAE